MQYDLHHKLADELDKYATRIELLEEELRCTNQALEQKAELAAALEQDLENAIIQLQNRFLSENSRINS